MATYADKRAQRSRYDRVLDLVADDLTIPEICQAEGLRPQEVRILIERGMTRGDARVCRAVGCEPKDLIEISSGRDPWTVISQDEVEARRSLRPLIESVRAAQEDAGGRNVTALLMGDPPAHRSALGRECRPDEYASKGEGRWRDPMLGKGSTTAFTRQREADGLARRLSVERAREQGRHAAVTPRSFLEDQIRRN